MISENIIFITQAAFSATGMVFSISMIAAGKDPGIYLPVITGILGYWLPSPKYTKKSDDLRNLQSRQSTGV